MSRRRPGDWMCPNCNFLIFASKNACKKCGAKKPGSSASSFGGPKSGKSGGRRGRNRGKSDKGNEWTCSNCSSSNYADRDQCRKCKQSKPTAVDSVSEPGAAAVTNPKKKPKKTNVDWTCNHCHTSNYSDRVQCRKCNQSNDKMPSQTEEKKTNENVSDISMKVNVEIELKLRELKAANKVDLDLVFIMDCTGSMSDKINAGKQTIKNIINELKNESKNNINNINFAYIAYRDQPKSDTTFITKVFPLTNDVNKMYEYLNSCTAGGGGDGPEALTEALHDALTKIAYNDNHIKINILIADAPGHGWNCTTYDNYPKGNPNGYDPIQLCYQMSQKGIVLYVLGCEPSISYYKCARDILEGMCKITEGYYLSLSNADLLPEMISNSLKQEINLKFIEKFIVSMMIQVRLENSEGISDEEQLLKCLDIDSIRQLKMENKMEIGNVYKGEYDYTNVDLIRNTFDDQKQQNMAYVLQNIKTDIKQPEIMKFSTKSKFGMKSGDWNCTKCHYHNFANRWFCRTCKNVNHTLKNGDWLCVKCEDINFGKNKVCRKCKVAKRPESGPNIIQRAKSSEKEMKQEIRGVECAVNDDIVSVVMNRIRKQRRFHDWKCKSCKYINFEANEKCRQCNVSKSDNFGDWKCEGCQFMNFGSRKTCKQCNKAK